MNRGPGRWLEDARINCTRTALTAEMTLIRVASLNVFHTSTSGLAMAIGTRTIPLSYAPMVRSMGQLPASCPFPSISCRRSAGCRWKVPRPVYSLRQPSLGTGILAREYGGARPPEYAGIAGTVVAASHGRAAKGPLWTAPSVALLAAGRTTDRDQRSGTQRADGPLRARARNTGHGRRATCFRCGGKTETIDRGGITAERLS